MSGPFLYDRVKETTTTTGTGTVNLLGAVSGYATFVSTVGNSNTCFYAIVGQTGSEWEVGTGTVTSGSPDTLSRTTVLASSNSNALVSFSAGTKDVFVTLPAAMLPTPISTGSVLFGSSSGKLSQDNTNLKWDSTNTLLKAPICDIGGQYVNVKAYGAKGDNSTDDTTAIQNAINAIKTTGGIVYFPVGTYLVSSTLVVGSTSMISTEYQSITLQGSGIAADLANASDAPWDGGTVIKWTGSGSPVIQVSGTYASGYLPVGGFQIKDLGIDGQSSATKGIVSDQMQFSKIENVGVKNCTSVSLDMFTTNSTANIGNMYNNITRFFSRGTPTAIKLDGNAGHNANTCHNTFADITVIYTSGGDGIVINDADNNLFTKVYLYRASGSGYGVNFGARSRSNYFVHLQASDGGVLAQTANTSGDSNSILYYDTENGQPLPTIQSGAILEYSVSSQISLSNPHTGLLAGTTNFNVGSMVNVKAFGATGDSVEVWDAVMTAGSATLTCSSTTPFLSTDVGKTICVSKAGLNERPLVTTISGYTSSSIVTLATAALVSVTNTSAAYGKTDDTAAIQAAIDYFKYRPGVVYFPQGCYLITSPLTIGNTSKGQYQGLTLRGAGGTSNLNDSTNALWRPATQILFSPSATAATMIRIGDPPNTSSSTKVPTGGLTIEDIAFHGGGVATHGIQCDRLQYSCIKNVAVRDLASTTWGHPTSNTTSPAVTTPATQATVAVTGGGSSGGLLQVGSYYVAYTFVNAAGETTIGTTESAQFTVAAGNIPRVTFPSLAANATSINLYITRTNDPVTTEGLYATGITGTTYDCSAAIVDNAALLFHTNGSTNDNCMHNLVERFYAATVPTAIRLLGNTANTANAAYNRFNCIYSSHTSDGIRIDNADNNSFYGVQLFKLKAGVNAGVTFGAYARANQFFHIACSYATGIGGTAGGGILAMTPAVSTSSNTIFGYSRENGEPSPTLQSTAKLQWTELGVSSTGWNLPTQINTTSLTNLILWGTTPTASNANGRVLNLYSNSTSFIPELRIENNASSGVADFNMYGNAGAARLRCYMSGSDGNFGTVTNHPLQIRQNNIVRQTIDTSGNVTFTGSVKLSNDTWITGRNAANSADINMFKINATNYIEPGARISYDEYNLHTGTDASLCYRRVFTNVPTSGIAYGIASLIQAKGVSTVSERSTGIYAYVSDRSDVVNKTITAAANNGSGLIRITSSTHTFVTGDKIAIYGVTGTTEANGNWIITRIDANNFDLQSSTFTNTYVSGGTATNRPMMYGVASTVGPILDRGTLTGTAINADDVNCFVGYNGGTGKGTDAYYLGRNSSSFPTTSEWITSFTFDANADYGIRLNGKYTNIALDFNAATFASAKSAIRLGNAQYIVGRNAAGSADVNLIRLTASNLLELATATYIGTNALSFVDNISLTGTNSTSGLQIYGAPTSGRSIATFAGNTTDANGVNFSHQVKATSTGFALINSFSYIIPSGGSIGTLYGLLFGPTVSDDSGTSQNITSNAIGVFSRVDLKSTYTGTVTAASGFYAATPTKNGGSGVYTNYYGVYVSTQNVATNNYGIRLDSCTSASIWLNANADPTTEAGGLIWGSSKDTNLYRSAASTLKTDDTFVSGTAIVTPTIGANTTNQHTLPAVTSDTIVLVGATQTLTTKTLTAPVLTSATAPTAAIGTLFYDSTRQSLGTGIGASGNAVNCWQSGVIYASTANAATTTTAETKSLVGTGLGTMTLPANFLVVGKVMRLYCSGYISTGATAGTITFLAKIGSVTIATTGAIAPTISMSSRPWNFEITIICRAVGSGTSANVFCTGIFEYSPATPSTATTAATRWQIPNAAVSSGFNSTTTNLVDFQSTTSNALHTITCANVLLEVLN